MYMADPTLSGDLVAMTAQYTKWSAEILHASDVPVAVRRAFKEAKTPPAGPVFLSFPWDSMDDVADVDIGPVIARLLPYSSRPRRRGPGFRAAVPGGEPRHRSGRPDRPVTSSAPDDSLGRAIGRQSLCSHLCRGQLPHQPPPLGRRAQPQQPGHQRVVRQAPTSFWPWGPTSSIPSCTSTGPSWPHPPSWCIWTATPSRWSGSIPPRWGSWPTLRLGWKNFPTPWTRTCRLQPGKPPPPGPPPSPRSGVGHEEAYHKRLDASRGRQPMAVDRMMYELAQAVPPDTIVADESITSQARR